MIKNIIILLGLPGSGKGTQGEFISKELAIPHISTGDILRKMVNEGCKDSELLATYMKEGKLIPDNLVNKLLLHSTTPISMLAKHTIKIKLR